MMLRSAHSPIKTAILKITASLFEFQVGIKKRRANAELEASMAHRLKMQSQQPRDARGRYMRTSGGATWKISKN